MRLAQIEFLFGRELAIGDPLLAECFDHVQRAVARVVWPPDADQFTICPEPKGNGVKPIKRRFQECLVQYGWQLEGLSTPGTSVTRRAGPMDALRRLADGRRVAVEWETGNVSSSHRALNKLALALLAGDLVAGMLVMPSRLLYPYLTDRIGNFPEIEPYFPLWRSLPIKECCLAVISVEQDANDKTVPLIPKGQDGNAGGS